LEEKKVEKGEGAAGERPPSILRKKEPRWEVPSGEKGGWRTKGVFRNGSREEHRRLTGEHVFAYMGKKTKTGATTRRKMKVGRVSSQKHRGRKIIKSQFKRGRVKAGGGNGLVAKRERTTSGG